MRFHGYWLLLAVLMLNGCQGVPGATRLGHLPIHWVPSNTLYADVQKGDPTAIAQLQLELLAKDVAVAELVLMRKDSRNYNGPPPVGLTTLLEQGLLFDWPMDAAKSPLPCVAETMGTVPTAGAGIRWDLPEVEPNPRNYQNSYPNYFLHCADPAAPTAVVLSQNVQIQSNSWSSSDPFRPSGGYNQQEPPLLVAPGDAEDEFRAHGFYSEGQIHALQTPEQMRLYCFGRYVKTRLDTYLEVFGQLPPDWATLLDKFQLTPLTYVMHADAEAALASPVQGAAVGLEGAYHTIEPGTLQFVSRYFRKPAELPEEALLIRHVVEYANTRVREAQVLEPALFPRAKHLHFEQLFLATLPAAWSKPSDTPLLTPPVAPVPTEIPSGESAP